MQNYGLSDSITGLIVKKSVEDPLSANTFLKKSYEDLKKASHSSFKLNPMGIVSLNLVDR